MQFFLYKPYIVDGEVTMGNCMELDGGEWVKIADVREALKTSHNTGISKLLDAYSRLEDFAIENLSYNEHVCNLLAEIEQLRTSA